MTDPNATADLASIRRGLAALPRADNHAPDAAVAPDQIVVVAGHRAALDPERALVVGNRGMGKSFWAHALANTAAREKAAGTFHELGSVGGQIGFNASDRRHAIAPTPAALREVVRTGADADAVWRAVLVRWVMSEMPGDPSIPSTSGEFKEAVGWVQSNSGDVDALLTSFDDRCVRDGKRLVLVFDALDRLADDWKTTRLLTTALLKRALAVRSYRALRLKLFMRRDQFEDPQLFAFPDGSKIRNTRVDLTWSSSDLYTLLFDRLSQSSESSHALVRLRERVNTLQGQQAIAGEFAGDRIKPLVDAIAGEYMGADKKRGRVYTWLPLHLADARGETSPRTFLTAWREAAHHGPAPVDRAVDHLGLIEGVRRASEDRLQELQEDYWWIPTALRPLRDQMVPMELDLLKDLWRSSKTEDTIREDSRLKGLAPIQLEEDTGQAHPPLVTALSAIGVIEIRSNGKINVPDIFRVEARIRRKGGVKPPKRAPAAR
ncbi:MAG: ATP-binding protein [Deltaproteobacteria bacterium]|nr:ATP-binding protein [Deltaproteobacteria bacterium]